MVRLVGRLRTAEGKVLRIAIERKSEEIPGFHAAIPLLDLLLRPGPREEKVESGRDPWWSLKALEQEIYLRHF